MDWDLGIDADVLVVDPGGRGAEALARAIAHGAGIDVVRADVAGWLSTPGMGDAVRLARGQLAEGVLRTPCLVNVVGLGRLTLAARQDEVHRGHWPDLLEALALEIADAMGREGVFTLAGVTDLDRLAPVVRGAFQHLVSLGPQAGVPR